MFSLKRAGGVIVSDGFLDALGGTLGSSIARAPWGWGVLIILVGFFVRLRPIMAKLAQDREASLLAGRAADNAELRGRVEELERRLEQDRTQFETQRMIDRHRINNLTQCLDALLMLLEVAPEKAAQHVAKIKEMRTQQTHNETLEKSTVQAAAVATAVSPNPVTFLQAGHPPHD